MSKSKKSKHQTYALQSTSFELTQVPSFTKRQSIFSETSIIENLKTHVELNDRDITEMLKTQKEYQQFGHCTCCGHHTLSRLAKIKSLIFTILFCVGGLAGWYLMRDRNEELSDRIFFYTIYATFLMLCIVITGWINFLLMWGLKWFTKDTWKVFYIKGIKNRLYLSLLSVLWFSGFWWFGSYIDYDYNENIFAAILCILISATVFLFTHLFIRFTALNGYFDIFKIEARKIKTYVTMIEMMANISKQRSERRSRISGAAKKKTTLKKTFRFLPQAEDQPDTLRKEDIKDTLFSIPVMNFLIDFPSENEKKNAKKERKKKVSFKLIREDTGTIRKISKHIMQHDKNKEMQLLQMDENKTQQKESDESEKIENDSQSLQVKQWLEEEKLEKIVKPLNKLNVITQLDLKQLLSDMFDKKYNNQSNLQMNIINQIKANILKHTDPEADIEPEKHIVSYSEWKKFTRLILEKNFIKLPNDADLIDSDLIDKKNTDIDEVKEIEGLNNELYSINLSSNIHTVKIINDKELDRLTRVVSHLVMVRLKQFKSYVKSGKIKIMDALTHALTRRGSDPGVKWSDDDKLTIPEYFQNNIYPDTFQNIFQYQEGTNKELLKDLAYYAWVKFAPKNKAQDDEKTEQEKKNDDAISAIDSAFATKEEKNAEEETKYEQENETTILKPPTNKNKKNKNKEKYAQLFQPLDVDILNVHIFKIFKDLLLLKQSIDSYTIIIVNLQRMVDVVTPLLLLFVYLSLFDFNFEDAMGFYISIVGIIGFFGSSYFSSVFASISFIMALNPFLVGDIISYEEEFYQVEEISLISCVFKHLQTGQLYSFQNKHLGESKIPIVNLSRSTGSKLKYRWILYFKHSITNGQITKFKKRCKELISKNRFTKNEYHWTLKVRATSVDEKFRKKVNISMRYDKYDNDVNSICFNYLTQAMNEYSYQSQASINVNTTNK